MKSRQWPSNSIQSKFVSSSGRLGSQANGLTWDDDDDGEWQSHYLRHHLVVIRLWEMAEVEWTPDSAVEARGQVGKKQTWLQFRGPTQKVEMSSRLIFRVCHPQADWPNQMAKFEPPNQPIHNRANSSWYWNHTSAIFISTSSLIYFQSGAKIMPS